MTQAYSEAYVTSWRRRWVSLPLQVCSALPYSTLLYLFPGKTKKNKKEKGMTELFLHYDLDRIMTVKVKAGQVKLDHKLGLLEK